MSPRQRVSLEHVQQRVLWTFTVGRTYIGLSSDSDPHCAGKDIGRALGPVGRRRGLSCVMAIKATSLPGWTS